MLDTAVAEPLTDHLHFVAAAADFRVKYGFVAQLLGIAEADNPDFITEAWWTNLSIIGFAATGITAQDVRRQLDSLPDTAELCNRLALQPDVRPQGTDKLYRLVDHAIHELLRHFWYLATDSLTLDGERMDGPLTHHRNIVEHFWALGLMIGTLGDEFPLPDITDQKEGRAAWRCNIYRLVLQLLGYQPAS
ncbi:hypothetical protein JNJ66_01950 [Candidatus Saccharibacteria bacterium]|nr:hypothetical protein [Candidatus Saccharibacteria bacterium]